VTVLFTVLFEPLDVLVFKDHRPFDAAEHSAAASRWPLPSTFFGALRTALMLDQRADFRSKPGFGLPDPVREWLGDQENPGKLQLRGPLLVQKERSQPSESQLQMFFPAPLYWGAALMLNSTLDRVHDGCRGYRSADPTRAVHSAAADPGLGLEGRVPRGSRGARWQCRRTQKASR
jgi:CRISPR type III-B/RAMP module-associated protein Cmr3